VPSAIPGRVQAGGGAVRGAGRPGPAVPRGTEAQGIQPERRRRGAVAGILTLKHRTLNVVREPLTHLTFDSGP
jgi:hypothetical protein